MKTRQIAILLGVVVLAGGALATTKQLNGRSAVANSVPKFTFPTSVKEAPKDKSVQEQSDVPKHIPYGFVLRRNDGTSEKGPGAGAAGHRGQDEGIYAAQAIGVLLRSACRSFKSSVPVWSTTSCNSEKCRRIHRRKFLRPVGARTGFGPTPPERSSPSGRTLRRTDGSLHRAQ